MCSTLHPPTGRCVATHGIWGTFRLFFFVVARGDTERTRHHTHTLVLLDARLDERQVVLLEALEAPERPVAHVAVGVAARALDDLLAHLVRVAAVGELHHQVVHDRAVRVVEQLHLVEDALDVALRGVVLREVPRLVLLHQLVRHAERLDALGPVRQQVLARLHHKLGAHLAVQNKGGLC